MNTPQVVLQYLCYLLKIIIYQQFCYLTIVVCSPHFYGTNCNTPCGQCRGEDVCNNVTGYCPNGCKSHWTGQRCDGKKHCIINCIFVTKYYMFVSKLYKAFLGPVIR